jgi:hypothetical protein
MILYLYDTLTFNLQNRSIKQPTWLTLHYPVICHFYMLNANNEQKNQGVKPLKGDVGPFRAQ